MRTEFKVCLKPFENLSKSIINRRSVSTRLIKWTLTWVNIHHLNRSLGPCSSVMVFFSDSSFRGKILSDDQNQTTAAWVSSVQSTHNNYRGDREYPVLHEFIQVE